MPDPIYENRLVTKFINAMMRDGKKSTAESLLYNAFDIIKVNIGDVQYEEFWIILLNRANRVLNSFSISEGGISGTVADPRKIYKIALENNASSVILCHNHPSGNVNPSDADIKLTHKLRDAGNHLDIQVLDHIIVGDGNYYSFADDNIL